MHVLPDVHTRCTHPGAAATQRSLAGRLGQPGSNPVQSLCKERWWLSPKCRFLDCCLLHSGCCCLLLVVQRALVIAFATVMVADVHGLGSGAACQGLMVRGHGGHLS